MENELLNMSSREFVFIRKNAGLSQRKFARMIGLTTGSAIYYWELQSIMLPYQVNHLKNSMDLKLWNSCRALWQQKEDKKLRDREEQAKKRIESQNTVK